MKEDQIGIKFIYSMLYLKGYPVKGWQCSNSERYTYNVNITRIQLIFTMSTAGW
jgi:hypothetical protein